MEIPVENVYYLLCYAWDKLEEKDVVNIDPAKSTDLVNLFARVLATGIDHLLRRGVDRGYLNHSEESAVLRGRIDFPKTLKRTLLQRAQAHCEFDELSYDVIHNRILKTTIRRLIRTQGLDSSIRDRLGVQYQYFGEVVEVDLSDRRFRSVQLYRNNYFYDFLLRICELLFTNLLPTQKAGVWKFRSFLQERQQMSNLFENFIRNFYRRELLQVLQSQHCKVKRENIYWNLQCDSEAGNLLPLMQTDVCITTEAQKILIECKYTADPLEQHHQGMQKLTSRHLFQVSSYLDNLPESRLNNSCRAILLYPRAKQSIAADFKRANGQTLSIRTIDLSQNWKDIHRNLLGLIEDLPGEMG